jgi:glucose-1-phosphate thymidylyltransferase
VVDIAGDLTPSARGELEITDVLRAYLDEGRADLVWLGRGVTWLDTGTHETLLEAAQFVRDMQHRQGIRICCVEEIAMNMKFITPEACYDLGTAMANSPYGRYLMDCAMSYNQLQALAMFTDGA